MATMKEKLINDMKDAMRDKDTVRKDVIQIVRAGVLQIEKDTQKETTDEIVMDVISKEIKKRVDVLPDYEKSGRDDLIENINLQLRILKSYLPEQLTTEQLSEIIEETIKETGASSMKDMGKIMQAITPKVKGKADNKTVSEMIKSKFN